MSAHASSSKFASAYLSPDNDDFDDAELYDSDDNNFGDWVEEEEKQPCMSLFGQEKVLGSLEEALDDAKKNHGVDLGAICNNLELDFYDRMRLVNFLRKQRPTPDVVAHLTGREPFFLDDSYLIPALEGDPLLQNPQEEAWSDEETAPNPAGPASPQSGDVSRELRRAQRTIRMLQQQLSQSKQDLVDYKGIVNKALGVSDVKQWVEMKGGDETESGKRGEDPQYFDAYEDVADDANLEI
ncbi:hypothetical protein CALVIDRAFT_536800 [Calocera viscosa TUFC12733]|uniref:type I protein arginine methyltransferase n=1 Tax=Calocera viscosa (strain TUFC12733) TaxID=1330018 RepID=A0A167MMV1_CALVF|nr:hypothetical protein CALVIDRAFT_536800 [Calocera viscosa TUFC12733]